MFSFSFFCIYVIFFTLFLRVLISLNSVEAIVDLFGRGVILTPLIPVIKFRTDLTAQQIIRYAAAKNTQEGKHVKNTYHDWVSLILIKIIIINKININNPFFYFSICFLQLILIDRASNQIREDDSSIKKVEPMDIYNYLQLQDSEMKFHAFRTIVYVYWGLTDGLMSLIKKDSNTHNDAKSQKAVFKNHLLYDIIPRPPVGDKKKH